MELRLPTKGPYRAVLVEPKTSDKNIGQKTDSHSRSKPERNQTKDKITTEEKKSDKGKTIVENKRKETKEGGKKVEKLEKEKKVLEEERKDTKEGEKLEKEKKVWEEKRKETREEKKREEKSEKEKKVFEEQRKETREEAKRSVTVIKSAWVDDGGKQTFGIKKAEASKAEQKPKPTMTKIAFADPADDYTISQRLNYLPHLVLMFAVILGTVFILGSVGSNEWMRAEVNGVTVTYGLFDRCVTNQAGNVTLCQPFDWPGWLYGAPQERMNGVQVLAILSILFASLFLLGLLLLLLISARCHCCLGWKRRASVILIDICFWLMVTSAGVSSILFLTGITGLQAYPHSTVLWAPGLYCAGWSIALIARLIIAACCDVHREESTLPFV